MKFIEIKKNKKGNLKFLEILSIKCISFDLCTNYIYFYSSNREKTYKLKLDYFRFGSSFFRKLDVEYKLSLFFEPFAYNYGFDIEFTKNNYILLINEDGSFQIYK